MTSGKENNIIELNWKLLKWTQKLVLKFLAAVKREKRNYQYLMTGNRKSLPLQDSPLVYLPATSFPPTSVLRQRSWYTVGSHFISPLPPLPAVPFVLHLSNWYLQPSCQEACTDPGQAEELFPHSESNMCFPQIHLLSHSIIFVSLSVFPTGLNVF